jgi:hypothetical protein
METYGEEPRNERTKPINIKEIQSNKKCEAR